MTLMPYSTQTALTVPKKTRNKVQSAKDSMGLTYAEFLELAAEELPEMVDDQC